MSSKDQSYVVSARKYRPATFETVVGQRALTATLKNAITGGKLAQAYLFCGPRGVGKTSCARIFAKTINCQSPTPEGEACGECESCKAIERGSSFNLVELDAASNNSVENIRSITEQVNIPAQDGRYRVFIIDEVHMLSNNAFNAFLKTLEEPPKNVVFILATTERHKVIPTILSRCQIYDFRRITVNDIINHLQEIALKEGVEAQREALGVIAQKADGAMRDALSIFDQVVASTRGHLTYEATIDALNVLDQDYYFHLIDIFRSGDVASALLTFKEITDKGFDAQFFINGLAAHIRDLMVSADPRTVSLLETSEEWEKKYKEQASSLPPEWYYNAIKILNDTDYQYRTSSNKRLLVELALIRLSRLSGGSRQVPFLNPDGPKPQSAPAPSIEASQPQPKPKLSTEPSSPPVGQTTHTVSPPPAPKKVGAMRPKSFRITNDATEVKKEEKTLENRNFSETEFSEAWEEFIRSHPDLRILVAAMRSSQPVKTGETEYSISVSHPAQKQAFETSITELTDYLKSRLGNDNIHLNISVAEENIGPKKMDPKEFLKFIVEENPALGDFLNSLDAELEV